MRARADRILSASRIGETGRSYGPRIAPRHPLRAGSNRVEAPSQPLLPGAPLHRLRHRQAGNAGTLPCGQGRGRLGCGVHGDLLRPSRDRSRAAAARASLGRRRREEPRPDVRAGACLWLAGRGRALPRRAARRWHVQPRGAWRAEPATVGCLSAHVPARDEQDRDPRGAGLLRGRGETGAHGRLRHRLRLRRSRVLAAPVPLAVLQPAHGRVRRPARQPSALLAGDARAGA